MDDDGNVTELDAAIEATWAAAQHDADMAMAWLQELVSEKQALWGPIWEEAFRFAADPEA